MCDGTPDADGIAAGAVSGRMGPRSARKERGGRTMKETVVLMAKAPVAGRVKTRLCPPSPPRKRRDCTPACSGTRRKKFHPWPASRGTSSSTRRQRRTPCGSAVLLVRAVPAAREGPRGEDAGRGGDRVPARGASRGDRRGGLPVPLAGTVRRAFRELSAGASVVFGPSADGGYYLVGLARRTNGCSGRFRWSTAEVLRNAAARCRILSVPFSFLPPGRDVDTGEDLLALREWARTHARPACPRTRGWITGFFGPGGGGFPGSTERTPGPRRGSRSRRGG